MKKMPPMLLILALVGALVPPGAAAAAEGAPYSVAKWRLAKAFDCRVPEDPNKAEPVLLVHGTFANREVNWSWNYWEALFDKNFRVCWVQLPDAAMSDAQISAEYAAFAIGKMAARFDSPVDVIGHSQGGLVQRWAIKWFGSGRHVDDAIALATPEHGTLTSDAGIATGQCFESCWQMATTSEFVEALNRDDETPRGADYTSIYTASDELVQPVGTQVLEGGTNILIQDICPGRPVDHIGIVGDRLTFRLTVRALRRHAGADPALLPETACAESTIPGSGAPQMEMPGYDDGTQSDHEPPLKPYAT